MENTGTPRQATSEDVVAELIDLIYAAAVEPGRWRSFVRTLSGACGGAAVSIYLQTPGEKATAQGAQIGLLDEYLPVFRKHLASLPWGPQFRPRFTEQFSFGSDAVSAEALAKTDFYLEYMRPQGLTPEGSLGAIFALGADRAGGAIAICRHLDDRPLGDMDLGLCNRLFPHLKRAYRLHCLTHGERERRRALAEVVDRFPMGVLLIDGERRCVIVNRSAEQILETKDGVSLNNRQLVAFDPGENEALQAEIETATNAPRSVLPEATRLVSITRPSGAPPFGVRVTPLLDLPAISKSSDSAAVVFIADPETRTINTGALEKLYSLTPSEAGLVCQLIAGNSLEEAAKLRGIRPSTARGYLKNAYQKTQTRGQRDLIRLILTGVSPMHQP